VVSMVSRVIDHASSGSSGRSPRTLKAFSTAILNTTHFHVPATDSQSFNPLEWCKGNYSVTFNYMKLIHWPFGCAFTFCTVRGDWQVRSPPSPSSLYQNVTAHYVNGQCTNYRIPVGPTTVCCSAVLMWPLKG